MLWVIGYDTIYAHQDKEDDAIVGVRSTARLFGENTKSWLIGLYGGALVLFAGAYAAAEVPMPALAGLLAAGAHMGRQIRALDIDDPDQCLRLFKSNNGGGLADLSRAGRRRDLGGAEADGLRGSPSVLPSSACRHFLRFRREALRGDGGAPLPRS